LSTFDRVAAYAREGFTVLGLAEPRFEPVAVVDDTFFETLGSPALAGRTFGDGDGDSAATAVLSERVARQISGSIETVLGRSITVGERRVVVIGVMPDAFAFPSDGTLVTLLSESAARILIPDVNPVGRQLPIDLPAGMRGRGRATVLGVVADVKYTGLESSAGPAIYVLWKELPAGQIYLALRTRDRGLAAVSALRAVLREADAAMPVMPIRRLDDVVQRSVADRRLRAFLGGSIGLLAVAIALVGVAGGLGRMVSERRHEFAIRAALGATPSRALRTVMIDGAIITATGIAAGMLSTLAMGSVLQSLVVGISPHDPATLTLVAMSVGGGSLLACYLPARRAAATNPLDMLRDD
jgi:hypothetical protein